MANRKVSGLNPGTPLLATDIFYLPRTNLPLYAPWSETFTKAFGGLNAHTKAINGNFLSWQRATSGTITAGTPVYTADGFITGCTGANITWARVTGRYASKYGLQLTGNTSQATAFLKQRLGGGRCSELYPGITQQVTFQAKIWNNTGGALVPTLTINHASAADNFSTVVNDLAATALTSCNNGALTTITYTFPSSVGMLNGLEFQLDFGASLTTSGKTIEIHDVDIRVTSGVVTGINPSPPYFTSTSISADIDEIHRQLYAISGITPIAIAQAISTTQAYVIIPFKINMRVAPTAITVDSAAHFSLIDSGGTSHAASAVAFDSAGTDFASLLITVASGLTAGQAVRFVGNNAASNLIFTGVEL